MLNFFTHITFLFKSVVCSHFLIHARCVATHTHSHTPENIKQVSRHGALITLPLFPLRSLLSRFTSSSKALGPNWSPDVSVAYHTHTFFSSLVLSFTLTLLLFITNLEFFLEQTSLVHVHTCPQTHTRAHIHAFIHIHTYTYSAGLKHEQ